MTETSNAASVVAAFGAAWGAHDLDAVLSMITDDCLFEATGPQPDGRQHKGRDECREAGRPIFDDPGSRFQVEESFTLGDRVVERWTYSWAGGHIRGADLFKMPAAKQSE